MSLDRELTYMSEWLRAAYEEILARHVLQFDSEVHMKGQNDVVTDCDFEVEAFFRERVREHFPGDGFLSEELHGNTPLVGRTWVLDPIDGTVNFSLGLQLFGLQVALLEGQTPVAAAVYLPCWNDLYSAARGRGATRNGRPISVRASSLRAAAVSLGDFSGSNEAFRESQLHMMTALHDGVRKIRMFGAACVDFTSLASGQTQAHVMLTRNIWDYAPGFLIATEAGACTNFDPEDSCPYIVCASDKQLLRDLIGRIGQLSALAGEGSS